MEINVVTEGIIGCALRVHRELGAGLLESVYESALSIELADRRIPFQRQKLISVTYRGRSIGEQRLDLVVDDRVVVELKSVERFDPVHEAQLLGYMRLGRYPVGLLINFNCRLLKYGIKRFVI